ncbi:MAG: 2-hydroxychromene-2-carboxylate isomerase [Deltaproteobacteria bacterium]|nr:2-hydroxychromene-2-carboxylate isomerase [Deltaproteobacteria bacterium]
MSAAALEFWFEFASSYSYPAAMRIERIAHARGVPVVWRPFLLGPIFAAQGWRDSPFNIYPVKGQYMWRDLERVCAKEGVALRRPTRFPRSGLLAARVASAAADEPWLAEFVRAVYRANFAEDREISEPEVIGAVLKSLGVAPTIWLGRAQEAAMKDRVRQQTEAAQARGIFGAPSFVVGEELFWGNDRLEDALDWYLHRR